MLCLCELCKLLSTQPSKPFFDGFRTGVSLQRISRLITHQIRNDPRTPRDHGYAVRILLSGDVHPNPGPTTKYPCSVCARKVTSHGLSYLYNRCSGWVHSKSSGLQNSTNELRTVYAALAVPHLLYRDRNRYQCHL